MAFEPLRKFEPPAIPEGKGEPSQVQRFAGELCRPSADDPMASIKQKHLDKAAERRRFVVQVYNHSLPAESAAELVAAKHWREYPILSVGGQQGRSALNFNNYRSWLTRLGKKKNGKLNLENVLALVDGYKGKQAAPVPEAFATCFLQYYLSRERREIATCWRIACQWWRREIRPEPAPSYERMQAFVRELQRKHPSAVLVAREGEEALRNQHGDYVERNWLPYDTGQVFVGDHRMLDCLCKVFDAETGKWRGIRPWITAWVCPVSGAFLAVSICDSQPNGDVVEYTLCNAIRYLGNQPPDWIYIDNGADFKRKGLVTPVVVDGVEHSICSALLIKPLTALPFNARAKTVERCFREVSRAFDPLMPGYVANFTGWRDAAAVNALLKNPDPLPTIGQVQQAIEAWIQTYYHQKPRPRAKGHTCPPAEALKNRPQRPALSDEVLAQRFARPIAVRKVGRGGRIELEGVTYQSQELWDHVGKHAPQVLVCRLAWEPDFIIVRNLDGTHLCQASRITALDAIQADKKSLSAKLRVGRLLESRAKKTVDQLTGQTRAERRANPAPVQQLLAGQVSVLSTQHPALPAPPAPAPTPAAEPDDELQTLAARLEQNRFSSLTPNQDDELQTLADKLKKDYE